MDHYSLLRQLYQDFNARRIDQVLAHLHADVVWPNGWEGGYVSGQQELRAYWVRQWQEIDPNVEPLAFERISDKVIAVRVEQVIKSLEGKLSSRTQLKHVYHFEEDKIKTMEISQ